MKVKKTKIDTFAPFSITLDIETKEEAQALYAIFNNCKNTQLFEYGIDEAIKKAIGDKFYIDNGNGIISNRITYNQYYECK